MLVTSKLTKSIVTLCAGAALAVAQTPASGAGSAAQQSGTGATSSQSGTQSGAQSGAQSGPISKHAGHNEDHGMSSNKGAGLMVGPVDQQFMVKAAQSSMMEIEAARLAQQKASSNEIKEFARKVEQDHTAASEKLKALAAHKNVDLPTDMGPHRAMLDKVAARTGDDFDKQWMKMQVSHHKKDVNDFQKHSTRAMDSDVRSFASATLPTLQGHLQQAQQLEGSTRGRSSSSSKSSSMGSGSGATGASGADSSSRPQGDSNSPTTR